MTGPPPCPAGGYLEVRRSYPRSARAQPRECGQGLPVFWEAAGSGQGWGPVVMAWSRGVEASRVTNPMGIPIVQTSLRCVPLVRKGAAQCWGEPFCQLALPLFGRLPGLWTEVPLQLARLESRRQERQRQGGRQRVFQFLRGRTQRCGRGELGPRVPGTGQTFWCRQLPARRQ